MLNVIRLQHNLHSSKDCFHPIHNSCNISSSINYITISHDLRKPYIEIGRKWDIFLLNKNRISPRNATQNKKKRFLKTERANASQIQRIFCYEAPMTSGQIVVSFLLIIVVWEGNFAQENSPLTYSKFSSDLSELHMIILFK